MKTRHFATRLVRLLALIFGTRIRDAETGEVLGKAILFPWRGKIHVIGYGHSRPLIPRFLTRDRASYWKQEIGFTTHDEPDYPREDDVGSEAEEGETKEN